MAIGIECQQLEMKFVVQFRSLFLLFLSFSVATADQMCKQRINFESQDTVWQTHMHTSTHTFTPRCSHTQLGAHALPNIFVNKLLHTFRQLLQLHLDAVLRLPPHSFLSPAPAVTLSSLLFPLPSIPFACAMQMPSLDSQTQKAFVSLSLSHSFSPSRSLSLCAKSLENLLEFEFQNRNRRIEMWLQLPPALPLHTHSFAFFSLLRFALAAYQSVFGPPPLSSSLASCEYLCTHMAHTNTYIKR